jgi:GST-like protein
MEDAMIELYTAATPNGQKIHIMLEEFGLEYEEHWIDIDKGEQFDPEFLKISPNNKIPALVDPDGPAGRISLFESGAILLYLAEKTGQFLPSDPNGRWETIQWLMWQMGGFGPLLGQAHHFNRYAPENPSGPVVLPYAQARYTNEAARLYRVLDRRLARNTYVAGDSYTIADIAIFPWCRLYERQGQNIDDFPNVKRWFAMVAARPAVARDMDRLEDIVGTWDEESWEVSFGERQRTQH